MKCLKCKKTFKDTLKKCPFCNTEVKQIDVSSNDDFKEHIDLIEKMEDKLSKTIELKPTKRKKRDNRNVSLDQTIAINVLNENSLSLMDEINKQIDIINEEADKASKVIIPEEELATLDSFKKRRKVLVITGIASLVLISVMIGLLLVTGSLKSSSKNSVIDYEQVIKNSLDTYYNTNEIDDLIYVMEDIKKDEEKVDVLQSIVKNTCYGWVIRYKEEDAISSTNFEEITLKYKELINGIYRYALVKTNDQYIRALTEVDYDELMLQFDDIYNESLTFYEALDLYNEKDYNRAYYMFSKIEEANTFYDKSVTYIDKIYQNVIELLNKDIKKIEKGIEELNNEEKLNIYIIIEETILEYDNVYNIDLSDYEEYQKILSNYTSKVSQYTDLVYNN